ncbi:ArsR/SmtB family transcription factor [Kitasatospora sp. NPDC096147]|uniref:ArsR/SmtB family transcription factor n=1 Tax=Kitasatospora sp. NPDC096147 TaxID=3364093 RepID=UPI003815C52A
MGEMHRFRLSTEALANASFALSPLQETVLGLRLWTHQHGYPEQTPWAEVLRPSFERLPGAPLLVSLVGPNRYVPDFLTPRPTTPQPDFHAELAVARALPPEQLAAELGAAHLQHAPELPPLLARGLAEDPAELLVRITDALEQYWERCVAPLWWPRARPVLQADLVHRSRIFAERGAAALFADLDQRLEYADGVLTIHRDWGDQDADITVAARGLVFTPTCFARGAVTSISPDYPPSIVYPARGQGTMSPVPQPPPAPAALELLLGAPKARLLTLLAEPASTTELAARLGVTPGAVSQHLAVLHATRLVTRTRRGRLVLYARSGLADELLGQRPGDDPPLPPGS